MRPSDPMTTARSVASLAGLGLLVLAAAFAEAAGAHMAAIGRVCGGAAPHCAACYAGMASALGAVLALSAGVRRGPREVRIRTRQ